MQCEVPHTWSVHFRDQSSKFRFKAVRGDNMIARGSYLAAGRGVHLVNSRPTAGQNMIALC